MDGLQTLIEVLEGNPNHDAKGRFATGGGGSRGKGGGGGKGESMADWKPRGKWGMPAKAGETPNAYEKSMGAGTSKAKFATLILRPGHSEGHILQFRKAGKPDRNLLVKSTTDAKQRTKQWFAEK